MCLGTFAALNRDQLTMASKAGQCSMAPDLDIICSHDVGFATRSCGISCFMTNPARSDLVACTVNCTKQLLLPGPNPGDGCLGCYGANVACMLQKCLAPCAQDAMGMACLN